MLFILAVRRADVVHASVLVPERRWQLKSSDGHDVRIAIDNAGFRQCSRLYVDTHCRDEKARMFSPSELNADVATATGSARVRVAFPRNFGWWPPVLTWNDSDCAVSIVRTKWLYTFPHWVNVSVIAGAIAGFAFLASRDSRFAIWPMVSYILILAIPYDAEPSAPPRKHREPS